MEPEGDPQKGIAKGHLAFTLDGARLQGRCGTWLSASGRGSGEKTEPWLLIKSETEIRSAGRRLGHHEAGDDLAAQRPHQRRARSRGEVRERSCGQARVVKREKRSFRILANFRVLERDCSRFS